MENNKGDTIPSAVFLSLAYASLLGLLNRRWCCHFVGWGLALILLARLCDRLLDRKSVV